MVIKSNLERFVRESKERKNKYCTSEFQISVNNIR